MIHAFTGWRGNFLLSAAEQWLKLELTKNFKVNASLLVPVDSESTILTR
jgi:hypothetical protein